MIPTKAMNPHTPVSPEEIAAEVLKAAELGVSIVHLHARDENEEPTGSKEVYADIIRRIREVNKEIIIGVKSNQEKLLVKSEDEYTSPISKIYKVETEYIIVTENSIYLVSGDIDSQRIS